MSFFDDLNKKVADFGASSTGNAGDAIVKHFTAAKNNESTPVVPPFSIQGHEAAKIDIMGTLEKLLIGGKLPTDARVGEVMLRLTSIMAAEEALGAGNIATFPAAFIIAPFLNSILDKVLGGNYRELEQAGNYAFRNMLLGIDTAITLFRRGKISSKELALELAKEGVSDENRELLIASTEEILQINSLVELYKRGELKDIDELYDRAHRVGVERETVDLTLKLFKKLLGFGEAIQMWRRGIKVKGDADAFDDMRRQGFTEERIEALKSTSHVLPNVFEIQDFKVRGVDDPAIVSKFQLDAYMDEDYFAQAAKLGYTKETATRLYRYYWNVPSLFILKELYSTGAIKEQDFRDLLRMSRFTPYWVDQFAAQLRPKLTQGDIKDLYKYQVISADEIVPKLASIGMTTDLAEQLKTLWVASVKLADPLNQTGAQAAAGKVKTDTASLIKTAYKDKVINREQALQHFKSINYTDEAAGLELSIADYELHQETVKNEVNTIKERMLASTIDYTGAVTELQKLGLSADQLDLYAAELQKSLSHKPKTPTLAEFTAWFKKGIITLQQLSTAISILGYADAWIPYFLLAAGASASDIEAAGLNFTTALSQ